jgi:predicted membrane-bound spermidine synthase
MKKTYIEKTNSGIDIVRHYDIIESFQTKYQKVEIIKNFDTKLETLFINENFQSSMLDEFFYLSKISFSSIIFII